jgi:hypothetical protein
MSFVVQRLVYPPFIIDRGRPGFDSRRGNDLLLFFGSSFTPLLLLFSLLAKLYQFYSPAQHPNRIAKLDSLLFVPVELLTRRTQIGIAL